MQNQLVNNIHLQSGLIAVAFVAAAVAVLFWLQAAHPPYQELVEWLAIVAMLGIAVYFNVRRRKDKADK